jgi:hypothetical protein
MKQEQFENVLRRRIDQSMDVLAAKNKEYSSDLDRLHNFKVAAQISVHDQSPEQALVGMWRKHLVSILDIVEGVSNGKTYTREYLDEKIGDTVNYTFLLEALLVERLFD